MTLLHYHYQYLTLLKITPNLHKQNQDSDGIPENNIPQKILW